MASCTYEPWTMKDLTDALKCMHKDRKEIVVPMFQRGKRWKTNQEKAFIDSLKKYSPREYIGVLSPERQCDHKIWTIGLPK